MNFPEVVAYIIDMQQFHQFFEAKGNPESGRIPAIISLAKAIQSAFKGMSRKRRKDAWNAINSEKGKKEIADLMNNPDRQISRFTLLKSFKEWQENQP